MESRISVISMLIDSKENVSEINRLLHSCESYIIGRMGIPYRERGVSIICVVMDAPGDVISSLSGKLGMIKGVSTKTIVSKQK